MSFGRSRWNLVAVAALACVVALSCIETARAAVTISVNTQNDTVNANDGHCSLREAVTAANNHAASGPAQGECPAGQPTGTTISVPDGTYVISAGQLQITAPVTISGTINRPTVFASNASRVFSISGGVTAAITGLEIAGGKAANGGGILNDGTLTLTDDTVDDNATNAGTSSGAIGSAGGPGGGIDNEGTATLTRVNVTLNQTGAGGTGSGISASGGPGGGIYNGGTMTLTDSTVTRNFTGAGASGGTLSLHGGAGGGIYSSGTLTVTGGTISSNATGNGGNGTVAGGSGGAGGGIEAQGTASITGTSMTTNLTGNGGSGGTVGGLGGAGAAIDASAAPSGGSVGLLNSPTVSNVTMADNARGTDHAAMTPGFKGGALNVLASSVASVTVTASAITGTTGVGVAVASQFQNGVGTGSVQLALRNTTISGGSDAGLFVQTISDPSGTPASLTAALTYATSTGNAGAAITNAGGFLQTSGPTLSAQNSLIAANGACTGTITDGGHNLSFTNAGCPGTSADPKLGTLGNHGGPTQTNPLLAGSPAIDAIPAADASCTGTDQRGVQRPAGSGCDIGAYEAVAPKLAGATALATGTSSATVTASVTAGDGDASITVRYGPTTSYGSQAAGPSLPAATTATPVTIPLTALTPGTTYHAQLVATSAQGTTTSGDLTFTTPNQPAPPPGGGSTPTPRLSALTITPASFSAAKRGASIAQTSAGATVSYRDSLAATTTFTVNRLLPGHRTTSGTCSTARVRKGARRGRACTKTVVVGQFRRLDSAGANSFRFTGRLNGKALHPGHYSLSATARLAGRASAAAAHAFTIRP